MNRRAFRFKPRGYVLLVMLGLILLVTLTGAAVYQQSEDQRSFIASMKGQSLAASRARVGAQRALAQIETDPALQQRLMDLQASDSFAQATANLAVVSLGLRTGPSSSAVDEGGGKQYKVDIYRRRMGTGAVYVMVSTGYFGSSALIERTLQSKLEVEFNGNFAPWVSNQEAMF